MQWIAEREAARGSKDRNVIEWTMENKFDLRHPDVLPVKHRR
jgi:hypothetical protein